MCYHFCKQSRLTDVKLLDVAKVASQNFIRAVEYYLNFFLRIIILSSVCDPLQKITNRVKHPAQYDSFILEISNCRAENDSIFHCESKMVFNGKLHS